MAGQAPRPGSARIRVAVVFGGRSSEHSVSLLSAGSVIAALDPDCYEVVPVGISRAGRWMLPGSEQILAAHGDLLPEVSEGVELAPLGTASELVPLGGGQLPRSLGPVDVVFPLLHGPFGEDGTLQGLLELAGVPYVGAGVFASAAAMDKVHMKVLLAAAGLPVGAYAVLRPGVGVDDPAVAAALARLRWPVFVKPARAGSSHGIRRVEDPEALFEAVEAARAYDPKVLVEEGIEGREIECGVLGGLAGSAPEASLPGEIVLAGGGFYDFEAKYLDGTTRVSVPADLPQEVSSRVRQLAVHAFQALDCAGLARVDFFLRPDGTLLVNELNTMPGFTATSAFPLMWAATGLPFPALVDRLVRLALQGGSGLR